MGDLYERLPDGRMVHVPNLGTPTPRKSGPHNAVYITAIIAIAVIALSIVAAARDHTATSNTAHSTTAPASSGADRFRADMRNAGGSGCSSCFVVATVSDRSLDKFGSLVCGDITSLGFSSAMLTNEQGAANSAVSRSDADTMFSYAVQEYCPELHQ